MISEKFVMDNSGGRVTNAKVLRGPNKTFGGVKIKLPKDVKLQVEQVYDKSKAMANSARSSIYKVTDKTAEALGIKDRKARYIQMDEYEEHNLLVQRARQVTKTNPKTKKKETVIEAYRTPKASPSPTQKQVQQQKRTKLPDGPDTVEFEDEYKFAYSKGLDAEITAMLNRGAKLEDVPRNIKAFGSPYQFLETADYRPWKTEIPIGRKYFENIMVEAPIVNFVPGLPAYLPDFAKEEKKAIAGFMTARTGGFEGGEDVIAKITKSDGRYFGFTATYAQYMQYVNLLCRSACIFLGLGDTIIPGTNETYGNYDWSQWSSNITLWGDKKPMGSKKAKNILNEPTIASSRKGVNALMGDHRFIKFFVDPSSSFSESISNSTMQSKIASLFDLGEGFSKELQFLSGSAYKETTGAISDSIARISDKMKLNGSSNDMTMGKLFNMTNQIVAGSNIAFPDMWSDTTYSKSYNFKVHLKVPYGNVHAYVIGIVAPLMHILGMVGARQTTPNSYTSPFLVKVFSKGRFSCELGLIDSITITKGGPNGDAWSAHGLPLEMEIDFSVRDLYSQFMIPDSSRPDLFFYNSSLLEYLSITAGLDITKPTFAKQIESVYGAFKRSIYDIPTQLQLEAIDAIRGYTDNIWQIF